MLAEFDAPGVEHQQACTLFKDPEWKNAQDPRRPLKGRILDVVVILKAFQTVPSSASTRLANYAPVLSRLFHSGMNLHNFVVPGQDLPRSGGRGTGATIWQPDSPFLVPGVEDRGGGGRATDVSPAPMSSSSALWASSAGRGGAGSAPVVVAVDGTLWILPSKQKPKKIKLLGSDEKVYPFLAKGGEDVRLDARVEQMFGIMNRFFDKSAACSATELQIRTYGVVPLAPFTGLIEWVDRTRTVRSTIGLEFQRRNSSATDLHDRSASGTFDLIRERGAAIQHDFIRPLVNGERKIDQKQYMAMWTNPRVYDRTRDEEAFRKLWVAGEPSLLRQGIQSLTMSSEAFLAVRSRFTRSLSSFIIGSYVLGLGDRHLDNFIIDESDGSLVGIDFGYAFDVGALLPIPELLPFRLSPSFVCMLAPFGVDGPLRTHLVAGLSTLQTSSDLLLDALRVFVRDPVKQSVPVVATSESATGAAGALAGGLLQQDNIFELAQAKELSADDRLIRVRRKLRRDDFRSILLSAIEGNARISATARNHIAKFLLAPTASSGATVSDQVEHLIRMATDPGLPLRSWLGLALWM